MSQLLTPANLEDVVKPIPVKRSSDFSKTQKNTTKINMLLKTLQEMDDEDASNLSVFNPPPKPVSIGSTKTNLWTVLLHVLHLPLDQDWNSII